ncbi:MAG: nucleotidyltransferase domain-containing protein, partial [Betaproteobacteria bacterium]|nr:nucleotidyltransferase domain-containing protein [Betaproteobacteria bacterium]
MVTQPAIDISPECWQIVSDLVQRFLPEHQVWAFGSRATWTAKPFSDLDLVVSGDEPLSLMQIAELREAFQESALPFKVDILDGHAVSPTFRAVINSRRC